MDKKSVVFKENDPYRSSGHSPLRLQSHHSMHSSCFRVGERDLFACFLSDKFSSRHIIKLFWSKLTFLGLRIRLEPANLGITRDKRLRGASSLVNLGSDNTTSDN